MPSLVLLSGVSRSGQNIDLSDRTIVDPLNSMGLRRQTDRQHYVISAVVFKCITCSTFDDVTDDVILPLGGAGQFF